MMNMKFWKRNAVIATMLLFLCVAIYLNWSYNRGNELSETNAEEGTSKILGEAVLVSEGENSADTVASDTGNDYFATARLTRKEARDSALALLKEAASVENASTEVIGQTADATEAMATMTVAAGQTEGRIISKGFADCVAFIKDDNISIVVSAPAEGLTSSDVAKITDIVTSSTNFVTEQIKIIEVK